MSEAFKPENIKFAIETFDETGRLIERTTHKATPVSEEQIFQMVAMVDRGWPASVAALAVCGPRPAGWGEGGKDE